MEWYVHTHRGRYDIYIYIYVIIYIYMHIVYTGFMYVILYIHIYIYVTFCVAPLLYRCVDQMHGCVAKMHIILQYIVMMDMDGFGGCTMEIMPV